MDGLRVHFDTNPIGFLNEFDMVSEGKKSRMTDNLAWATGNEWEMLYSDKGRKFPVYSARCCLWTNYLVIVVTWIM